MTSVAQHSVHNLSQKTNKQIITEIITESNKGS